MSVKTRSIGGDFASLHKRLAGLKKRYRCTAAEMGRIRCDHGDGDLYPQLENIAADALRAVRRHHGYFAKHALYGDGMFWYELFLTISAAAHRVRADKAERYIPESVVDQLVILLIRIARYSTVQDLDITERNYEALGNTLLTFYSKDRVRFMRSQAKSLPVPVKRLVKRAIDRVSGMRLIPRAYDDETFAWWIDEPELKGSANPCDDDLAQLREQGFSVGMSLLEESTQSPNYDRKSAIAAGWTIHSIPIPENHAPTIEQIHEFIARLSEAPDGAKIVVFCQSGKGRTACMGAAYWIAQGLTTDLAIERMRKRCLDPEWSTPERRYVLKEFERILHMRSDTRSL